MGDVRVCFQKGMGMKAKDWVSQWTVKSPTIWTIIVPCTLQPHHFFGTYR